MPGTHKVIDDTLSFEPVGKLSSRLKFILSILFVIFVVIEASFLYWQFGVIVHKKSAKDVSLVSFSILLVTNVIWILYATFIIGSIPVLTSGILYVIGASLVIAGKVIYKDGTPSS